MRAFVSRVTLVLGVSALAASALGADIWATDNLGEVNGGSVGDRIIRFDSSAPATPIVVGQTGVAGTLMGGLDFDGSGNLWAWGQIGAPGLYSINQSTGAATFVGNNVPNRLTLNDLAWDPAGNRMLAIGSSTGRRAKTVLASIDLTTGNASLVSVLTGSFLPVGLGVSSNGTIYMHDIISDQIFTISGSTATPLPSPIGYDSNFSQGMTIDWSHGDAGYHGAFNNLTFATELYSINLATGAETFGGNIGPFNSGTGLPEYETGDVAIAPAGAVPEPTSLALLTLAGLLGLRRR